MCFAGNVTPGPIPCLTTVLLNARYFRLKRDKLVSRSVIGFNNFRLIDAAVSILSRPEVNTKFKTSWVIRIHLG
jgi:hypothetical protein